MIWSFKKDVIKNVALDFMLLVLKWRPASLFLVQLFITGNSVNPCFTCTVDKTHHGPVATPFFVRLLQFFLIRRRSPSNQPFLLLLIICLGYAANNNTQGAFVIIFLICSDYYHLPQKLWHHSRNNRKWLKQSLKIWSSSENINNTARVSRLSSRFLWLWLVLTLTFDRAVLYEILYFR